MWPHYKFLDQLYTFVAAYATQLKLGAQTGYSKLFKGQRRTCEGAWSQLVCVTWHNTNTQSFYGPLSGTTRVSRYQKKHSPTQHPDHHPIFISFFHLLRSVASSLFKLRAWQSFRTTSLETRQNCGWIILITQCQCMYVLTILRICFTGSNIVKYVQSTWPYKVANNLI